MNKTKIEYLDYCWNFMTGCLNWKDPNICGGGSEFKCWAKAMADRYGRDFTPMVNDHLKDKMPSKPSKIGVCFTGDLFGGWVDDEVIEVALDRVEHNSQHQFYFLTKCHWNLENWLFPENAWVGVSVTSELQFAPALWSLNEVQCNKRWLSIEPMLEKTPTVLPAEFDDLDWIVIGGLSNKPMSRQPKEEWVKEIVDAARKSNIPVFVKDNIRAYIKLCEVESERG